MRKVPVVRLRTLFSDTGIRTRHRIFVPMCLWIQSSLSILTDPIPNSPVWHTNSTQKVFLPPHTSKNVQPDVQIIPLSFLSSQSNNSISDTLYFSPPLKPSKPYSSTSAVNQTLQNRRILMDSENPHAHSTSVEDAIRLPDIAPFKKLFPYPYPHPQSNLTRFELTESTHSHTLSLLGRARRY